MPLRLNAFGVHILLIGLGATPRDRLRGEAPLRLSRGKRKCRPWTSFPSATSFTPSPLGDTAAKKGGDAKTDDRKSIRSEVSLRVGEFLGFDWKKV